MRHAGTDDTSDASPVEQADIAATRQLAHYHHNPALRAVTAFSQLADQPPLLAASGAVVAWGLLTGDRRLARRGGHLVASVALATLLKGTVKRALSRTRPHVLLDEGRYQMEPLGPDEGSWHSFPSGHTAGGVTLARAVARCWPSAWRPAYAGAAAVGIVQVPRGAHYPSDVLAGVVIGVAAEAIVHRLFPALAATPDR
jgi:membrane-associated phospholipid phosphatase